MGGYLIQANLIHLHEVNPDIMQHSDLISAYPPSPNKDHAAAA